MLKALCGAVFSILFGFSMVTQAYAAAPDKPASQTTKKAGKKSAASKHKAKSAKEDATPKQKAKGKAASRRQAAAGKRGRTADRQAKDEPQARGKLVKKVVVVNGRRKVVHRRVAARAAAPVAAASAGDMAGLNRTRDPLELKSNVALVLDQASSRVLLAKNADVALPIASITKLMTSLVVLEANQNMREVLDITTADIDHEKNTTSRLRIGSRLTRDDLMHIALMSSENRAASALGRNYPGGTAACVAAMNAKARALGMTHTHYADTSGLSSHNVASASDLAKLVVVASRQPLLRQYSTDTKHVVDTGGHILQYASTNQLVKNPAWDITLQKTGYIAEAGRCLVMQAKVQGRPIVMVFLDSKGKHSRLGDATRVRKWLAGNGAREHSQAIPQS
ncbi:MAG: serine hydrolase [Burkholderiaceae bacterium]|nr:serine hydrolase [Burkholderiaceae bacterium]